MSHSHLKREGSDIHYTAEISLSDALNGGTAKVKHFNETHSFKFEVRSLKVIWDEKFESILSIKILL